MIDMLISNSDRCLVDDVILMHITIIERIFLDRLRFYNGDFGFAITDCNRYDDHEEQQ